MPQFGTWFLANIFTALLPPIDGDEEDFYDILEVPRNASHEQIKKAYKLKSLKLHPDKVAQRKESNAEEAAAKYEKVQEAYGVLLNDEKRSQYHALQCSPKRYRFINQGALTSPGALYENLTNANTVDKTRLVVLCTVIILVLFLQPILIASKVNQILGDSGSLRDSRWITLLIPAWGMGALWIAFQFLLLALSPAEAKLSVCGALIEYMLWFAGFVLLALKWDNTLSASYARALCPLYFAMIVRWSTRILLLLTIRRDVARMVTVDFLEKHVLQGKSLDDLSEEEQEAIQKKYLVVTVPPDFEPEIEEPETIITTENGEPIDKDELIELQKVEHSPEYDSAMEMYFSVLGGLLGSVVFGLTFMIVLTLKLDRKIDASYWIVFIPVWIYHGSRLTYYFTQCMCGTIGGEEILMQMQENGEGDEETGEADKGDAVDRSSSDRAPDSDFCSPSTNMSTFNKSKSAEANMQPEIVDKAVDDVNKNKDSSGRANVAESSGNATSAEGPAIRVTATKEPGDPSAEKIGETKTTAADAESDGTAQEDDNKVEQEDEHVHIDEETFRAWQNAYEEAERSAMEEQAKASGECCNLSVQLMILLLVVAKIDEAHVESDDPGDPGFNTFWILFPFFVVFGLILCCCACLIYGAAPGSQSDLTDVKDSREEAANEGEASSQPVIVPAPPAPQPETEAIDFHGSAQNEETQSPVAAIEEKADDVKADVESGKLEETTDMDELD